MAMTLKNWLDRQGFPHGMECVGEARLQQLWDSAQHEMREECANKIERLSGETYAVVLCEHKEAADWLRPNI